ncbi:hypothetical protein HMPREF9099_00532 [Lachnospiraceae bacterium oral taxon 082 str. F0431]|nr:hypothetical protein HMPREF9099_00532 [Lachnospiraceae bacterium oral taxon 082 str. F0431]
MGKKVIKMKFNIYDYKDNAVEIDTKGKDVASIFVEVISGDECIEILYKSGCFTVVDSSSDRFIHYHDGSYKLSGDKLAEWARYTPTEKGEGVAYERLWKFGADGE